MAKPYKRKASSSCGNNSRLRRMILEILFYYGPMTRYEIMSKLSYWDNKVQPSAQVLSSLLTKTQAIVQVGTDKVASNTGRMKTKPTFDIDRRYIEETSDIIYCLPKSSLYAYEKSRAVMCNSCKRFRIPWEDETCLRCIRTDDL